MTSEFSPKFPRSIAGGDYRTPLDRPDVEAVAARADHLYRTFSLSDEDRALLIERYAMMARDFGLVFRYRAYVERLENKYGLTALRKLGEIVNREGGEVYDASHGVPQLVDDEI
ncbi:hypothetical protein [Bradyrhizobium sp. OAE829]|uniref:hypothetical protein n=1 Tax=Bradyrhizobium sp. OAE829 TaxID=2663807 RepID=UPI001789033C